MLYVTTSPGHALSYDDDAGMNFSSKIDVGSTQTCSSACYAVIGGYGDTGTVRLTRDDDVVWSDADGDGLGAGLEQVLLTSASNPDTDGDGISDGTEVMGLDDIYGRYPFYGASPTQRDLFLEDDWRKCVPGAPLDGPCVDATGSVNVDLYRWGPAQVAIMVAKFTDANIRVHVDNGISPPVGTTTDYGNWGGATGINGSNPPEAYEYCEYVSAARSGFHGLFSSDGDRGVSGVRARCFLSGQDASAGSHEFGHALGLDHHGKRVTTPLNCKPNYPSLMNYAYDNGGSDRVNARFSHATRMTTSAGIPVTLNPSLLIESDGVGPYTTDKHDLLATKPFALDLTPQGVDWDRDGLISSVPTRAAISWNVESNADCGAGTYALDDWKNRGESTHMALGWMPQGGSEPLARLFWINRRFVDDQLMYRYVAKPNSLPANGKWELARSCGETPNDDCSTQWYPSRTNLPLPIPVPFTSVLPTAVVGYNAPGSNQAHAVVFANLKGQNQIAYVVFNGTSWSSVQNIPGDSGASGPPTAVHQGDYLYVYAPYNGRLREWYYNILTNQWSGPNDQYDSNFQLLAVGNTGATVTLGHLSLSGTPFFGKVIAYVDTTNNLRVAYRDALWQPIAAPYAKRTGTLFGGFTETPYKVFERPSISYVPAGPNQLVSVGRFYIAWNGRAQADAIGPAYLVMSQGNAVYSTTAYRQYIWNIPKTRFINAEASMRGSIATIFDPAYDTNLHAAWASAGFDEDAAPKFAPIADDIVDAPIRDVDDLFILHSNMACSLYNPVGCPQ